MLYQIHHQNKKDREKTEMVAQRDLKDCREMTDFINEINPVPPDCDLLAVREGSKYFVYAVADKGE